MFTSPELPQLCDVRGERCCGTPACLNAGVFGSAPLDEPEPLFGMRDEWFAPIDEHAQTFAEPMIPIAECDLEIAVPVLCYGGTVCSCSAPGTMLGCGGCCADLGGCQGEHEREMSAPHVWLGDGA